MSEDKAQDFLKATELIIEYAKEVARESNIEITKAEWDRGKEIDPNSVAHTFLLQAGSKSAQVFMRREGIEQFPSGNGADQTRAVVKGMIVHIQSQPTTH